MPQTQNQSQSRKKLLVVAFHFPPFNNSTGYQRPLAIAKFLTRLNWDVTVLTADTGLYPHDEIAQGSQPEIDHVEIIRARGFDAKRDFSIKGKHLSVLSYPDRYWTWIFDAIRIGQCQIERSRPVAIWVTYPIPSALIVADLLARFNNLPKIVDLRDPIALGNGVLAGGISKWIEKNALLRSSACIFTTEGTRARYLEKYGNSKADTFTVIPNGYDPDLFRQIPSVPPDPPKSPQKVIELIHAGSVYPGVDLKYRGPGKLFEAISNGIARGLWPRGYLRVKFLGSTVDPAIRDEAEKFGISKDVECIASLPPQLAMEEMRRATALLLLQGSGFDAQIPAKIYEYLRLRRPILALCGPKGETARLMDREKAGYSAAMDDSEAILQQLQTLDNDLNHGNCQLCPLETVEEYSRENQIRALSKVLDEAIDRFKRQL